MRLVNCTDGSDQRGEAGACEALHEAQRARQVGGRVGIIRPQCRGVCPAVRGVVRDPASVAAAGRGAAAGGGVGGGAGDGDQRLGGRGFQ